MSRSSPPLDRRLGPPAVTGAGHSSLMEPGSSSPETRSPHTASTTVDIAWSATTAACPPRRSNDDDLSGSSPSSDRPSANESPIAHNDYRTLVALSSSWIACFQFTTPLAVETPLPTALEAVWSPSLRCVELNEPFARGFGFDECRRARRLPFAQFFPNHRSVRRLLRQWVENNYFLIDRELKLGDCALRTSLIGIFDGPYVQKLWIVMTDVSGTMRAMRELRSAERHYRTMVERPGLVLVRTRPNGQYLYISPHVEDVVGYSREAFRRNPSLFRQLLHPDDVAVHEAIYEARRQRSSSVVEVEYRVRRKDGTYRWFFERQIPKLDAKGRVEYYDSIAFEIHNRKLLEEELSHARRMELIGSFAGSIAHDFNNHLTAILGQLSLTLDQLGQQHPAHQHVTAAEQAAQCCAEMARYLLEIGRRTEHEICSVALDAVVRETVTLLTRLLPSSIRLITELPPQLPPVTANAVQLQQVLVSLAINARDAMPEGGSLLVRAKRRLLTHVRELGKYSDAPEGRYVEVSVSDTGRGIPPERLRQVFEPFVSTKEGTMRNGLGLSMVYSIITAAGGFLNVQSIPGRGTTIRFILPEAAHPPRLPSGHPDLTRTQGNETVLVAEDDELVRSMVVSALEMQGYRVISAANGAEALTLFEQHQSDVAIVILDQTMPKLSGRQVAQAIRNRSASVPLVLTSGYSAPQDGSSERTLYDAFVHKPYSLPSLYGLIRTLLDRRG